MFVSTHRNTETILKAMLDMLHLKRKTCLKKKKIISNNVFISGDFNILI